MTMIASAQIDNNAEIMLEFLVYFGRLVKTGCRCFMENKQAYYGQISNKSVISV